MKLKYNGYLRNYSDYFIWETGDNNVWLNKSSKVVMELGGRTIIQSKICVTRSLAKKFEEQIWHKKVFSEISRARIEAMPQLVSSRC